MKEIKAKYGRYDFCKGNNIFYLTEEKVITQNYILLEDINIIIREDGTLEINSKSYRYDEFYPIFSDYYWSDRMLEIYDLEGRNIEDFTKKTPRYFFNYITGKRYKRIKPYTSLRRKDSDKDYHLKTSNWTIKWS